MVEYKENSFETVAENLLQIGLFVDLGKLIDSWEKDYPNDANVFWYLGRWR